MLGLIKSVFPSWLISGIFLIGALMSDVGRGKALADVDVSKMDLGETARMWSYNPDGSCVQCSIAMCGVHCNDPRAATLLWDTPYGPGVRGGSWPARVSNYCAQRGIKAWNVTGSTTIDWCRWAVRTGRFAAIGADVAHFQTLWGYDYRRRRWLVCNNQTPKQIDEYSEEEFRNLHYRSGPWVVILERPSSEAPQLIEWWK